ncbi:MAG: phenylalanine--tRNA ligase subunit alpha [Candidatus Dependentiae bacterium]
MIDIQTEIANQKAAFLKALEQVDNEQTLEMVRIDYVGRNGHITNLMKSLKNLSIEQKREFGPKLNALKQMAESTYEQKKEELFKTKLQSEHEKNHDFDVTAYKPHQQFGHLHVYTHIIEQLENIFISMGYDIVDGPELETDFYNFEALNIPSDHPARDHHDTFWVSDNLLLRTHTSPVQIRAIENSKMPIAIFAPGRTYRNEATDASHDFMFMQGECLFIDKKVSLSNLLATAQAFLQAFFQKDDLHIRVRPGFFPFVEPGLEIDASCPFCTQGCSICKKTGWIELLGSGLVHPNVLKCSGIDPEKYSGFAFGFGIERLAMIKYGINDIRLFHSSKVEFLDQF